MSGFAYETPAVSFPNIAKEKRIYVAADLNVRDNFAVFYDAENYTQFVVKVGKRHSFEINIWLDGYASSLIFPVAN